MRANDRDPGNLTRQLRWPLGLTRAGLVAERLTYCFWPFWTLAFTGVAALALGFQDWAPVELYWAFLVAVPLGLAASLIRGALRFRWPSADEARARLDGTLPGRPLASLADHQAIGAADPQSRAVWSAHLARMAARLSHVRPVAPAINLAPRDPVALRYAALAVLIVAALFGSLWRVAAVTEPPGPAAVPGALASWEGWIEPPAYTGKPTLYLSSLPEGSLDLPAGSRFILRLYGPARDLTLSQDLADLPDPAPGRPQVEGDGAVRTFDFVAVRSGQIEIEGEGGRRWQVRLLHDAPPEISLTGEMDRMAEGTMSQPFRAADDYAVTGGEVRFELDLAAVDRRFGLAPDPEPRAPLIFSLPLPVAGSRAAFEEVLAEDASQHPWANLPVTMTLSVTDGAGQTGSTGPVAVTLPGRRFFDPLAAAIIEMRRDLLWSRENARRTDQILRAISHRPEGFIQDEGAYLKLRVTIRRLTAGRAQGPLAPALRDEVAQALWDVAVLIEDGGLDGALERMREAQERLSEAMKRGASKDEIQKLMDELRRATDDYMQMLADRGERDPADQFTQNQPRQTITQDQIQEMMDEIQRLMEEGRMAEAQELLEQLNQLMENLQVTEGEGGEGQDGPNGQAMRDLEQTLRDQQDLSDDAFREGQRRGSSGAGEMGSEPLPGQGQGQQEEGGSELENQRRRLPDAQGQDAENARRALDQAGRAMEGAEEALRQGDLAEAIDRQAEAIENLREGMRSLGEAFAQDPNRLEGPNGQAQAGGDREMPLDPLGRQEGTRGQIGDGDSVLSDRDVYGRARALLDEIRRRSADRTRPEQELDYLRRLLDQF
jgi:uncharacterized protein (TIGR02302 family)